MATIGQPRFHMLESAAPQVAGRPAPRLGSSAIWADVLMNAHSGSSWNWLDASAVRAPLRILSASGGRRGCPSRKAKGAGARLKRVLNTRLCYSQRWRLRYPFLTRRRRFTSCSTFAKTTPVT